MGWVEQSSFRRIELNRVQCVQGCCWLQCGSAGYWCLVPLVLFEQSARVTRFFLEEGWLHLWSILYPLWSYSLWGYMLTLVHAQPCCLAATFSLWNENQGKLAKKIPPGAWICSTPHSGCFLCFSTQNGVQGKRSASALSRKGAVWGSSTRPFWGTAMHWDSRREGETAGKRRWFTGERWGALQREGLGKGRWVCV